jgi:hypothetical protein
MMMMMMMMMVVVMRMGDKATVPCGGCGSPFLRLFYSFRF